MIDMLILLAQKKDETPGMGWGLMLPWIIGIVAIMYFMMIRPEKKRQKKIQEMRDSLSKKDKIVTAGGIRGTVKSINEQAGTVQVIVDDKTGTTLTFSRTAILRVLTDEDDGKEES